MTNINGLMDKAETHLENAESRISDITELQIPENDAKLKKFRKEIDEKFGKDEDSVVKYSAKPEIPLSDRAEISLRNAAEVSNELSGLKNKRIEQDYVRLATKYARGLNNVIASLTTLGLYDKLQFGKALSEADEDYRVNSIMAGISAHAKVSEDDKLTLGAYVLGKVLDYAKFDEKTLLDLVKVPEIYVNINGKMQPLKMELSSSGINDKKRLLKIMKLNSLENLVEDYSGAKVYIFNGKGPYSNSRAAATMLVTAIEGKPLTSVDLKEIYTKAKKIADYVSKK